MSSVKGSCEQSSPPAKRPRLAENSDTNGSTNNADGVSSLMLICVPVSAFDKRTFEDRMRGSTQCMVLGRQTNIRIVRVVSDRMLTLHWRCWETFAVSTRGLHLTPISCVQINPTPKMRQIFSRFGSCDPILGSPSLDLA